MTLNHSTNGTTGSNNFTPPPLPPGFTEHHIVALETTACTLPTFEFPHKITKYALTSPDQLLQRIKDASIVITCVLPLTPEVMDQVPHIRCVAVMAVGISWLQKEAFAKRGITVTNTPRGNVNAVSEHFLGLYFAARRRTVLLDQTVKKSDQWLKSPWLINLFPAPPLSCSQEVLGILGTGALGSRIKELAQGIGIKDIMFSSRKSDQKPDRNDGRVNFDEVIKRSTVIAVCVPLEPDTIDLIGERELQMMRKETVLINVARGGIVNEAALAKALKQHWISGAATDVLQKEPNGPGGSPLIPDLANGEEEVPNLTISPHLAWFSEGTLVNYQNLLKAGVEGWVAGTLMSNETEVHPVVAVHNGKVWR